MLRVWSYWFTTVVAEEYDGSKTIRQGLWHTLFPGENWREILTNSELLRGNLNRALLIGF